MTTLAEHIAGVRLVDNHVHGCWLTPGGRRRFENGLNEGNIEPPADCDSGFDTQLGFAIRAHCAPLLGLPEHVDPQVYWERRRELTEDQLAKVFLPAAEFCTSAPRLRSPPKRSWRTAGASTVTCTAPIRCCGWTPCANRARRRSCSCTAIPTSGTDPGAGAVPQDPLHYLGSALWRAGMAAVLTGFVTRGQWSQADAMRIVDLIGRDNARRIYRLS